MCTKFRTQIKVAEKKLKVFLSKEGRNYSSIFEQIKIFFSVFRPLYFPSEQYPKIDSGCAHATSTHIRFLVNYHMQVNYIP